jgi:tRNA(Ile)-lysidine synthase
VPGAEHPPFTADELNSLFAPAADEPAIALAVSGGSDSLALMHLAARWAGERRLAVLTVDHGLRHGSAGEAEQVARWVLALGLAHATLQWEGEKPQTGIQAKARTARYRLMADWCERENIRVLMTAHTQDDQAETVLMRMARGTSIEGLAAMAPVTALRPRMRLVRPLLGISRQRLRAFLSDIGQTWIDDPSNEDERFERARVRKALPALARAGVTTAALTNVAALARQAHLALDQAMLNVVERHSRHHPEGYAVFPRQTFNELTEELKARVLDWHIRRYGGGVRPERSELTRLAAALSSEAAARHTLGGAIIAPRKREVIFGREPARIDPTPLSLRDGMIWDNRFRIRAARTGNLFVAPAESAAVIQGPRDLPQFVRASMPAIIDGKAVVAVPLLGIGDRGFATEFRPADS